MSKAQQCMALDGLDFLCKDVQDTYDVPTLTEEAPLLWQVHAGDGVVPLGRQKPSRDAAGKDNFREAKVPQAAATPSAIEEEGIDGVSHVCTAKFESSFLNPVSRPFLVLSLF